MTLTYLKEQEEQMFRQLTFKYKIDLKKKNLVMSPIHKAVIQRILCLIFLMVVRTMQCLNYGGHEPKQQFAVNDSDTFVTLKQGQNHQTWYELVDSNI